MISITSPQLLLCTRMASSTDTEKAGGAEHPVPGMARVEVRTSAMVPR